jgi:putative oxidoreductase
MDFVLRISAFLGRVLLGLFFLLPGIMKLQDLHGTATEMTAHNVPYVSILMPLAIGAEIAGGLALVLGFRVRFASLMLIGFTAAVNYFMHDFWSLPSELYAMEMQLFIKNLAVIAGLLIVFGLGAGPMRVSRELGISKR